MGGQKAIREVQCFERNHLWVSNPRVYPDSTIYRVPDPRGGQFRLFINSYQTSRSLSSVGLAASSPAKSNLDVAERRTCQPIKPEKGLRVCFVRLCLPEVPKTHTDSQIRRILPAPRPARRVYVPNQIYQVVRVAGSARCHLLTIYKSNVNFPDAAHIQGTYDMQIKKRSLVRIYLYISSVVKIFQLRRYISLEYISVSMLP